MWARLAPGCGTEGCYYCCCCFSLGDHAEEEAEEVEVAVGYGLALGCSVGFAALPTEGLTGVSQGQQHLRQAECVKCLELNEVVGEMQRGWMCHMQGFS